MRIAYFITTCFIFFSCSSSEKKVPYPFEEEYELCHKYVSDFPDSTQLSIAIINDDNVRFIGFEKTVETLLPTDNKYAVFEIGSITKVFTATILAQLIKKNKICADDPIEKYLPYSLNSTNYDNKAITIKTLTNHTSGFPRMPDNYNDIINKGVYSTTILDDFLRNELTIRTNPGHEYHYSNLGYAILGYLTELLQQKEYEEILQQMICEKYGLNYTSTRLDNVNDKIISGRDSSGFKIPNRSQGVFNSAGGIMSNVVDLTNFVKANFNNDSILEYQRNETYRRGNFGMALGWQISYIGNKNCKWYHHNGGMDGYRSSCFLDVNTKTAVVILSNLSAVHPVNDNIDSLAFQLLKREFLKNTTYDECGNSFIERALKNGWGAHARDSLLKIEHPGNSITGVWSQTNNNRLITRTFTSDNKVQTDFYRDKEIDVWGYYKIEGNQIIFTDIGGAACAEDGIYEYKIKNDTLIFTPIKDNCEGRKAGLLKNWIRIE